MPNWIKPRTSIITSSLTLWYDPGMTALLGVVSKQIDLQESFVVDPQSV